MNKSKRFQIEVVKNRKIVETIRTAEKGKDGKHLGFKTETKERIVPESYMVFFPAGHSCWFETKDALAHAGLIPSANIEIDLDTGLPILPADEIDIKQLVEARTQSNFMSAGR
jgi:hypothetical protein